MAATRQEAIDFSGNLDLSEADRNTSNVAARAIQKFTKIWFGILLRRSLKINGKKWYSNGGYIF